MKKIAIEEHYLTKSFLDYFQSRKEYPILESTIDEKGRKSWQWWNSAEDYHLWVPMEVTNKLSDIGEGRLKEMDEAGIDMQVLSFNENIDRIDATDGTNLTKKINDDLSAAIKKYPDRFAGFAALAPKDPKAAADELERAVIKLGFKGAMILPHVCGEFIDAKKYWPIFEMAAKLGVPIYIHPMFPPPERQEQYSDYFGLSGAMWGFGAEAGLVALRLICSGIFDEYPNLNIILGHLGEALPFWMWRIDNITLRWSRTTLMSSPKKKSGADTTNWAKKLKKLPSQYLRDNFFITNSGMLWQPALLCTHLALGAERILFSVDYPFESCQEAAQFIETAPISEVDKEKIFHLNTEKLLGL